MNADDRAFDLLMAVADHTDRAGLRRTTMLVERAMDALLAETGRLTPDQETGSHAPQTVRKSGPVLSGDQRVVVAEARDDAFVRAAPFRRHVHS